MQVILASGSPRRRDLLQREGVRFTVRTADADESLDEDLAARPHEAAKTLAWRKAAVVAYHVVNECIARLIEGEPSEEALVIGADTMVVLDGRIFGKPVDADDAAAMLACLSGRTHEVITGVSVWRVTSEPNDVSARTIASFEETSYVSFHELSKEDIQSYLACGESFDKAGAYAVQGEGARLVSRFEGDYDNIVGLPVKRLLADFPQLLDPEGHK